MWTASQSEEVLEGAAAATSQANPDPSGKAEDPQTAHFPET